MESLSRGLHEAESALGQLRDEEERACVSDLILGMKKQMGGFFRAHIDRRREDRGTSPIGDYEGYFLARKAKAPGPQPRCPFCGSDQVLFRRRDLPGPTHWYCTACRQEIQA